MTKEDGRGKKKLRATPARRESQVCWLVRVRARGHPGKSTPAALAETAPTNPPPPTPYGRRALVYTWLFFSGQTSQTNEYLRRKENTKKKWITRTKTGPNKRFCAMSTCHTKWRSLGDTFECRPTFEKKGNEEKSACVHFRYGHELLKNKNVKNFDWKSFTLVALEKTIVIFPDRTVAERAMVIFIFSK